MTLRPEMAADFQRALPPALRFGSFSRCQTFNGGQPVVHRHEVDGTTAGGDTLLVVLSGPQSREASEGSLRATERPLRPGVQYSLQDSRFPRKGRAGGLTYQEGLSVLPEDPSHGGADSDVLDGRHVGGAINEGGTHKAPSLVGIPTIVDDIGGLIQGTDFGDDLFRRAQGVEVLHVGERGDGRDNSMGGAGVRVHDRGEDALRKPTSLPTPGPQEKLQSFSRSAA